jgi:hypothetical protein
MNKPTLIATDGRKNGLEVWARFVDSFGAQYYELFASEACDDYIGDAETPEDAKLVAQWWFADRAAT